MFSRKLLNVLGKRYPWSSIKRTPGLNEFKTHFRLTHTLSLYFSQQVMTISMCQTRQKQHTTGINFVCLWFFSHLRKSCDVLYIKNNMNYLSFPRHLSLKLELALTHLRYIALNYFSKVNNIQKMYLFLPTIDVV